ncbi:MAG: hypothetical protein KDA37_08615, partial [Planctomycetales bacterium]|nr:hypothetical protein [Planctomycetales bacterium]
MVQVHEFAVQQVLVGRRFISLLSLLSPLLLVGQALADLQFDFGEAAVAANSVRVDATTSFSDERGFGWLDGAELSSRDRSAPDDARRDFVVGTKPATFRISGMKPGNYSLEVVSGDMDYGDHATRVRVTGSPLRLPVMTPALAEFATLTASVQTGVSLDLTFDSPQNNWVVNSITLSPSDKEEAPRIALQREEKKSGWSGEIEPSLPEYLPDLRFHLTARPWRPANAPRSEVVDQMDRAIHAMSPLQFWDEDDPGNVKNGAIIDPFDHKEVQYGTPLFAFNVATLLREGRCADLVEPAARAMDRATLDISDGPANDWHGEFFCAAMVKAIRVFEDLQNSYPKAFTPERLSTWKKRMKTPRTRFFNMKVKQNWRTFAMKGEWLRQQDGYISDGVAWNEACWLKKEEGGQRERFRRDLDLYQLKPHWFFYHDDTADPETFAYNGATTANLLDSLLSGYDGPSAQEMQDIISHNLRASLLMLSGSGEAPAGGRTGEHIWDDSIYANAFQDMAVLAEREGDLRFAGQLQRAVYLLLRSHARFQQENGWFSITKNLFPPALKNRYASWSGVANYEGFTLACCSETLLAMKSTIPEQPIPSEIGGYAMQ